MIPGLLTGRWVTHDEHLRCVKRLQSPHLLTAMNIVVHTNTKVGLVPSMELDIVTHGSLVMLVLRLKSRGIRIRVAAIYVEWVNWVDHGGLNLVKNIINNRKRVISCHFPLIN